MVLRSSWGRIGKIIWLLASVLLVILIGMLDFLAAGDFDFSPFYLIPIIMAGWTSGLRPGLFLTGLSMVTWSITYLLVGHSSHSPEFFIWNALLRLANFLLIVALVARVRNDHARLNQLARTDPITGLANARSFKEFIDREVARLTRYDNEITLLYIDLDNFKAVNDQFGHQTGDQALRQVGTTLTSHLRKSDFVARVGGDEFVIVLTETGQDAGLHVSQEIQAQLNAAMAKKRWPITFSIGVVINIKPDKEISTESILRQADKLMYEVKMHGKNNIKYEAYQPGTLGPGSQHSFPSNFHPG